MLSCLLSYVTFTSLSFPPSDSLSSPSPSTLYHLTLNYLPSYPCYILHSSSYIWSPIHNLSWYVSLSACSICSGTLSIVPQSDNQPRYFPYLCPLSPLCPFLISNPLGSPDPWRLTAEGRKTAPKAIPEIGQPLLTWPPPPCYIS